MAGHAHTHLWIGVQIIQMTNTLMKQKQKQQLVNNQINAIRKSIKALQAMTKTGFYLDERQRNAIACIHDLELAPLSFK